MPITYRLDHLPTVISLKENIKMRIKPTPSRRNVVIDIETVSLDASDPKGALSALTGRIACVCLLIDDGNQMQEVTLIGEEAGLLHNFWQRVQPSDVFIGYNLLNFDLLFIRQRSWILGVRPSRKIDLKKFYTYDLIDLMQLWTNWGSHKYVGLDQIAEVLGCGTKSADGSRVAEWWQTGKIAQIAEYCMHDVRITYLVFLRLMFQAVPARFTASPERRHLIELELAEAKKEADGSASSETSTLALVH
jgi:predicted PolB exonuclease-like 3'-5' exonuclease